MKPFSLSFRFLLILFISGPVILLFFNAITEKSFSKILVSETCSSDGKIVEYKDGSEIKHKIVITCPTLPPFTTDVTSKVLYAGSHDRPEFTCEKYRSIFATQVDCVRKP